MAVVIFVLANVIIILALCVLQSKKREKKILIAKGSLTSKPVSYNMHVYTMYYVQYDAFPLLKGPGNLYLPGSAVASDNESQITSKEQRHTAYNIIVCTHVVLSEIPEHAHQEWVQHTKDTSFMSCITVPGEVYSRVATPGFL